MQVPARLPGFAKEQKYEGLHKYLKKELWPPCETRDLKVLFSFSATACLGASTQIRVGAASSAVRVYEGGGSVRVRRPASFQVVGAGSGLIPRG